MIRTCLLLIVTISIFSCNDVVEKENTPEPKAFFPLAYVLETQWKDIDSFHLPISKTITTGSKTDFTASSLSELKAAADEFLTPDITQPPHNKKYNESSFADQSIPSITLTYSSDDKSLQVQRLDILLQPDPVANDKLRNVYMEKRDSSGGVWLSKKILLIADRSLQIITSSKDSTLNIVKFTWDGLK